jgi:hypothetical protein
MILYICAEKPFTVNGQFQNIQTLRGSKTNVETVEVLILYMLRGVGLYV